MLRVVFFQDLDMVDFIDEINLKSPKKNRLEIFFRRTAFHVKYCSNFRAQRSMRKIALLELGTFIGG